MIESILSAGLLAASHQWSLLRGTWCEASLAAKRGEARFAPFLVGKSGV